MAILESHERAPYRTAAPASSAPEGKHLFSLNPPAKLLTDIADAQDAAMSVLRRAVPTTDIVDMELLNFARVQQDFLLRLMDGQRVVFSLGPTSDVKILRHERENFATEAAVLNWLRSMSLSKLQKRTLGGGSIDPIVNKRRGNRRTKYEAPMSGRLTACELLVRDAPTVLTYSLECFEREMPSFSLMTPPKGISFASLGRSLSQDEGASIDWQSGQLLRRIASQASPTGKFGHALDVLGSNPPSTGLDSESRRKVSSDGFATWPEAFHVLLEEILRDLEDFRVQIPYEMIRGQFQRLKHLLGGVRRPSLIAVEGAERSNLLITSRNHAIGCRGSTAVSVESDLGEGRASERLRMKIKVKRSSPSSLKVTGLRDWSNCVFGDPLFSTVFAHKPSPYFIKGAYSSLDTSDPFDGAHLIEDHEHSETRRLLYECYHCLCGIAKCYSRPRDRTIDMELHWRKRLLDVLTSLSWLDGDGKSVEC